jgi:hypothetical protein
VKIDQVRELWETPEKKWHAIRIITRLIAGQKDYTFSPAEVPVQTPDAEEAPIPADDCPM